MTRTRVYIEAARISLPTILTWRQALVKAGYDVVSTWHDEDDEPPVQMDLARLASADLLLVAAVGTVPARTYTLVGFAVASGQRLVVVGPSLYIPADVRSLFVLQTETWEELAENEFLKLGSARFKKIKVKVTK